MNYSIPYGKTTLSFVLPDDADVTVIAPREVPPAADPGEIVLQALDAPLGGFSFEDTRGAKTAAIAINDKTRPVPHTDLLPPLLERLEQIGIPTEGITLMIATGAHTPMRAEEFIQVVPPEILSRYRVICHDCDDRANLLHFGETLRGTPIWLNRSFYEADLRIAVGNIEPHQFQGFSGGVKSASIGLAGRETIDHNHAMMLDPLADLGEYDANPTRQDVEEIGRVIEVHLVLNTVLNTDKHIVHAIAGEPSAVMLAGIPLSDDISQVPVTEPFDLTIVSPGGHPKDINLYQSQKALAHAARVTRPGGTIMLAAACPDGSGSSKYEDFAQQCSSAEEVIERFRQQGFTIGPHKAFQFARETARFNVRLLTDVAPERLQRLHLASIDDLQDAIDQVLFAQAPLRIGILPAANATIPYITTGRG